jgi:hypothetical protein
MLIAGVVCLCVAVATAALGLWTLARPRGSDLTRQVLRSVAPTQLAAAIMLAAGGMVAIAALPRTGLLVLVVCVIGAVATVAAGSWQGARYAARREAVTTCAGGCATCTLSCR